MSSVDKWLINSHFVKITFSPYMSFRHFHHINWRKTGSNCCALSSIQFEPYILDDTHYLRTIAPHYYNSIHLGEKMSIVCPFLLLLLLLCYLCRAIYIYIFCQNESIRRDWRSHKETVKQFEDHPHSWEKTVNVTVFCLNLSTKMYIL